MFGIKKSVFALISVLVCSILMAGCGGGQQSGTRATQVKAMNVLQQDTPLTHVYAGQIVGTDEVNIQSRVSGNIVEKYVQGGQLVTAGQPLYRIDDRQYRSAVLQAQATLAQSEATLNNARMDLSRYEQLYADAAISEQTLTTQRAQVSAYEAAAAANAALLRQAQENLDDTTVYAPMTGQLSVNDVGVGTFVSAGTTTLVSMGTSNPIYAQFSLSENEYLNFVEQAAQQSGIGGVIVQLTLSNGSKYPLTGHIATADRALATNTGTLTLKALFDNPDGLLLPGMFARVSLIGDTIPNALLVPERAVQQLLGKSFVMVVGDGNKAAARTVTLGDKVGSYYVIKDGIDASDIVVVEGLTTLQEGGDLAVTMVTPDEMGFSIDGDDSDFNTRALTPAE
ncbi:MULTISPECIES: efflux RND transporter periplasmic adaptor subunit [Selenomonas]|uniref:Efflux transporter, RND family, MFP subunit n=1 Tax=Selenomonas artemidis F0399 TaxID=749551 RepID=E7N0E0_9FIRM|nr:MULTISPECIES: efflux RND transporter periplasmic adaptor subunit [Selenomonas]EFR40430.1 efflux transporter, RND family, MFP subunit [Selenomonas sp. oral taxon 137 str. F0430]EFW30352.1 efflux transporter, RND family, MFP subunit [Selenomonas artemidis F0399]